MLRFARQCVDMAAVLPCAAVRFGVIVARLCVIGRDLAPRAYAGLGLPLRHIAPPLLHAATTDGSVLAGERLFCLGFNRRRPRGRAYFRACGVGLLMVVFAHTSNPGVG